MPLSLPFLDMTTLSPQLTYHTVREAYKGLVSESGIVSKVGQIAMSALERTPVITPTLCFLSLCFKGVGLKNVYY